MPARSKWSQFAIVLGRALLVSSFVEDAVRHGWEWSEDLNWVHARLHIGDKYLPWFACAVLLALEIGLQLAGSLLVVANLRVTEASTVLLAFNTLRPLWQVTPHRWIERCAAFLAGFVLVVAQAAQDRANTRSEADAALGGLLTRSLAGEGQKTLARCLICIMSCLHFMHPDMIGNMLFTLLVMMCLCGAIILGVAVKPCALTLAVLLFSVAPEIFPYWDDFAKIDYHRSSAAEGTVARLKMKYVNSQFQFYQTLTSAGSMLLLSQFGSDVTFLTSLKEDDEKSL